MALLFHANLPNLPISGPFTSIGQWPDKYMEHFYKWKNPKVNLTY